MPRQIATVLALAFVAACTTVQPFAPTMAPTVDPTPPRALGVGEMWVPVELWQPVNGIPVACGGVGYEGEFRLHGSPTEPRVVWMTFPDGTRRELAWPLGYSARFTPELELLDETGLVVAREDSVVTGGCGTPQSGVLWVSLEPLKPDGTVGAPSHPSLPPR